jgi:hypothetical protein
MSAEPVVSVVIAAFHATDFLERAIASALAQTFVRLEVIVSDDADDPHVERLARAFADSRVVYRCNQHNLGPAGNHAAAFAHARGKYLAILNHDDLWRPTYLAQAVPHLECDENTVLVFCDHEVIDADDNVLVKATDECSKRWGRDRLAAGLHEPFPRLVVQQTIPLAMGAVFRRAAIELPNVGPAYDLWLTYALCRGGGAAYYLPERLTAWRVHVAQLTSTGNEAWAAGGIVCWRAMLGDLLFQPYRRTVAGQVAACARSLAKSRLARGDRAGARASALLALRYQAANWRALALLGLSALPRCVARALGAA